jgi:GT2 family glycosyltransferase
MPMLSVIIPARNAAEHIGQCLSALRHQTHPELLHELIVVDNGSTDNTAAIAQQHGALVVHQPKQGAAAARNAGIAIATGEIICCTDADCIPTADWLAQVSAPLRAHPHLTACKGTYLTHQTELVARFVQIEYEDKYDLLHGQKTIDFIDTYSAAYRREALVGCGGFNEEIFYVEDQELSFRLAAQGHQMVFQPTAVVYHLHAHTLAGYLRKKYHIAYWKTQVTRQFPQRAIKDSHTPQVMKVQMALLALLMVGVFSIFCGGLAIWWGASGLFGVWLEFWPLGWGMATAALLLFLLTTLPFVAKAWGKDKAVALASPILLAGRALALIAGVLMGALFPPRRRGG